jgi:outer membrane protein TolC
LSLPFFDSGATRAQVRQAQSEVATADYNEQDISQQIALELRQADLDLQNAQERRQSTEKDVEQAKEALRLAQVRYQAGVSPAVEVIDAETAFAQSRSNQVNARYDYQLSQARLNYALGRPLNPETSVKEESH